jgi:putative transposase
MPKPVLWLHSLLYVEMRQGHTIYRWKAKFGGMEVSDAKRLRDLETENNRLKKLLAETMLEKTAVEDALRRKW